ncbi:hypothetical protein MRB53_028550 [Persea americana]|uniref:Uncharacterized protein n=1 Tax=Persea americana TaxID=3435 RepID=A0ACC2KFW5_PERAE|nr:hypothetical protein MRB53_028550 [Persea americana]
MKTIATLQQEERLMQFLMGLNDSFSAIRSQILLMDPLPAVNKAYSLVLQEENQRLMRTRYESQIYGTNIVANEASATSFLPSAAAATQNQQHFGRGNMPKLRREHPRCSHCNKLGHTEDRYCVKHGYPLRDDTTHAPQRDVPHTANNAQSTPLETSTSVPQFTNEQYHQLSGLFLSDLRSKKMIGVGRQQGGLYTLQPPNAVVFSTSRFDLWHWRLGHPSNSHLKDLIS